MEGANAEVTSSPWKSMIEDNAERKALSKEKKLTGVGLLPSANLKSSYVILKHSSESGFFR